MASYHCQVKTGGKGRAGKHADYVTREGAYSPANQTGKKLEDLEHTASINMPKWAAHDTAKFWQAADKHERANGATYREFEIALPREMTPEQRVALVEDFIKKQLGNKHVVTYAIHLTKATIDGGDQPHAHIMYSEKLLDGIDRDPSQFFKRYNAKNPEKGGCQKDSAGRRDRLLATRELWAEVQNAHLEKHGFTDRVTHLSLRDQGIDRYAERHQGPIDARKNAPAIAAHREAHKELEIVKAEIAKIDITAELAAQAAAAEAAREAIRQAQETAAAAEQARAAASAAAAAELAAETARASAAAEAERQQQIKEQQQAQAAKAAAEAQAAHDREIEINQEKEDDRIRAKTIAALGKSSAATDSACAIAVADHEAIDRNIGEAGKAWGRTADAVGASARDLNASRGDAKNNGANLGKAISGAERRVTRERLESCAPAVRTQLGAVSHVIRQTSQFFRGIIKTIARATVAVIQQRDLAEIAKIDALEKAAIEKAAAEKAKPRSYLERLEREAKAEAAKQPPTPTQQPTNAPTPVPAKTQPTPAIPGVAALPPAERKFIEQMAEAIARAAAGDTSVIDQLARDLNKHEEMVSDAQRAAHAVAPPRFDWQAAERDARDARTELAKTDVNAQAQARGITAVPYPPGTSGLYTAEHYSSYETALKKAKNEVGYHAREPRPTGFFNKKETTAYDATTAKLEGDVAAWEREIKWRDTALTAASNARTPEDAARIEQAQERHNREHLPAITKAAPAAARQDAHKTAHAALRERIAALDKPTRLAIDTAERDDYSARQEHDYSDPGPARGPSRSSGRSR